MTNVLRIIARPENLVVILLLAAWTIASQFVPVYRFPSITSVLAALQDLLFRPDRLSHTLTTLGHIGLSVLLGMLIGLVIAVGVHYWPLGRRAVYQRLNPFLNAFPGLGWIFLAIIWFGLNSVTVVFAITMLLVPFAIINIREGLVNLDSELMEFSQSFTRNRVRTFFRVVVPLLVPFLFGALRICFGVGWKVALTTEMFGGNAGYGYLVSRARHEYDTPLIFAIIILIIAFVYLTDQLFFKVVQKRLQRQFA
jgi:NitT/TauT family transport system permease protein/sulfonate transport system permease protein